jgi:hypothetical protein
MLWSDKSDVLVKHDGIKVDRDDLGAVLFKLESTEEEADGCTWIPRSLMVAYDDEEIWIPKWKAEQLGCDFE